ncbi:MAG: rhamnulokinase [Chitinivibrionales bacterium]|nr:rhamnulokinase [Chitinivibrionales bacterium]
MSEGYVGIDLGANSGRVLLGVLDDKDTLTLSEAHRFPNGMLSATGQMVWNILGLYQEICIGLAGMALHKQKPVSIAIDTWGVDFGLLDKKGRLVAAPVAYRDSRTEKVLPQLAQNPGGRFLFDRTGVPLLFFNTICQLTAMVQSNDPQLEIARDLLFMPDLLSYLLSGVKSSEYTFATTAQLLNYRSKSWDDEIFSALKLPRNLMQDIIAPGSFLGPLRKELADQFALPKTQIIAVGSHDTASAVAAVPAESADFVYISCGTWSLMGIETASPIVNDETFAHDFTNEGGVAGTIGTHKNIMGLWLLQECRRIWTRTHAYTWNEITALTQAAAPALSAFIDPARSEFAAPADMPEAINAFLKRTGQSLPQSIGHMARIIQESLALEYRFTFEQLQRIAGRPFECIHLVGGGSLNAFLCAAAANACGVPVLAGPQEATIIGNVLTQAMAGKRIASLKEMRAIVRRSFPLKRYEPADRTQWDAAYERFVRIKQEGR